MSLSKEDRYTLVDVLSWSEEERAELIGRVLGQWIRGHQQDLFGL